MLTLLGCERSLEPTNVCQDRNAPNGKRVRVRCVCLNADRPDESVTQPCGLKEGALTSIIAYGRPWVLRQHYRCRRHGRLHSARPERTTENIAVTPKARSVHTKKKASLDLPISPPTMPPAPFMWTTGTTNPKSDPRKMMMYPALRSASASVPYS